MSEPTPAPAPVTKCGTCLQADDHPKHQIQMAPGAFPDGSLAHHPHDFDRNGQIFYHFDCDTDWHQQAIDAGATALADHIALAKSGVHGDALRTQIMSGVAN